VNWRGVIQLFIACTCASSTAAQKTSLRHSTTPLPSSVVHTQNFDRTVVRIDELKFSVVGIKTSAGTGFCLDPACRFIGTNYHVAIVARPHRIKGQRVIERYLATGPEDEGATLNEGGAVSPAKYALSRDLAIFELLRPLPHHYGIAFSLDDLQFGQQVNIYAYPKESVNPIRKLLRFTGTFKGQTTTGLLAFDYNLSAGKAILPGASGGIVVDAKTDRIVGVLNATARNAEEVVLAVPIQSLVDFVSKVQPFLAQSIFPSINKISPVSKDLYPQFVPATNDVLEHRPEEPPEVSTLRRKAQLLADSMRNFIAVQRLAWGSGDKEPAAEAAYEVRVIDGSQTFRWYPEGKKELEEIPIPPLNHSIVPGSEWSELPEMVGTELRLKVHQAADASVNDKRIKVFQYSASLEDALCKFKYTMDYLFFVSSKTVTASCYGEVWTDENTNIVRISEHYQLPGERKIYHIVVTYGWLRRANDPPVMIPLTFSSEGEGKKHIDWCRGQFTDYQVFSSRVRILADN
jgi:hypothetical protein